MCYNSPGPRCAGHTRTLFRQTKAALIVANANFEAAKDNLSDADDLQAQAKLAASESLLKLAQANHGEASKNYEASKAVRAEKMEDFRKAKDAYCESAEGIQALRDAGKTDEAEKYAAIREMKMEELKRVEAAKDDVAKAAVRAVLNKEPVVKQPVPDLTGKSHDELKALSEQDDITPEMLHAISSVAMPSGHSEAYVRELVARHEKTSGTTLDEMYRSSRPGSTLRHTAAGYVDTVIAQNPNTPAATLASMATQASKAGSRSPELRATVAGNPNTPNEVLAQLAGDESDDVRGAVGLNDNCPPSVLESLSQDSEFYVRRTVAKHPKLPVSAMLKLKDDDAPAVVAGLAINTALPVDIQRELVGRRDPSLNKWLAKNKSISKKVLKGL